MHRYFVSGAAGFLGSNLVDALLTMPDSIVICYDNLSRGKFSNLSHHLNNENFGFIEGDIRDYDKLKKAMRGCDIVFHLAAQSNVMGAFDDPDYCFESNVTGTYNMLKASLDNEIGNFIFSSSREVYGDCLDLPVEEKRELKGKNIYAASKISGEALCNAFRNSYGMNINVLRLGNVYGERDFGRVIPEWIRMAKNKEVVPIYGGNQILDFIYIKYVVDSLISASTKKNIFPINVGSGQGTSILRLFDYFKNNLGLDINCNIYPARNIETIGFVADVLTMKNSLGVNPPLDSLEDIARLL